jgi:hypothetical protein
LLKSIFRIFFLIIQFKIQVNLILADGISSFHSSEVQHGGVTGDTGGGNDVGGCDGNLISDPPFSRGVIE